MKLIIPSDVGGTYIPPQGQEQPTGEPTAGSLVIPSDVGGEYVEEIPVETVQPKIPETEDLTIVQAAKGVADVLTPKTQDQDDGSWTDIFTGADRTTRATEELPELGRGGLLSGEDLSAVAKIAPVLAVTYDPLEVSRIIQANFPDIRQTEDEKGNIILNNNKTGAQVVVNKPGFSYLDLIQGGSAMAAFTPAAKAAALLPTAGKVIATGATGAGLTETAIQTGQEALGGEFDISDIASSTALGGAGEAVMPAIQAVRGARAKGRLGAEQSELASTRESVEEAVKASEAVGGRLFKAQQTALPSELEKQSFIGMLPAGTRKATEQLKSQNKEAGNAVTDFLGQIAPDEAVITGPAKFRTAAQSAIEKTKHIRSERASPFYKEAFQEGADVDLKPVNDLISDKLIDLPEGGEIAKSLKKASNLMKGKAIKDEAGEIVGHNQPTLKQLHNAKLEIDQMLNKFGENSLGNTTKRELTEVKNALLDQIDEASPMYSNAKEKFAEATPNVIKMQDSIIGKVADLTDNQLKTASRNIFDAAETNPSVIKNAKKVINDVDPDAWNQLLRSEMERRIGSVRADLDTSTVENIPGQLYRAMFGNKKQREVLYNAVDGQTRKNMRFLETYLKRASLGRPGGSQTAGREEIKAELRGGVVQGIRNFFSAPLKVTSEIGGDVMFDKRVSAMSDAMFDPQWKAQMIDLRKLDSSTPASARAMTQLLNDIEDSEE